MGYPGSPQVKNVLMLRTRTYIKFGLNAMVYSNGRTQYFVTLMETSHSFSGPSAQGTVACAVMFYYYCIIIIMIIIIIVVITITVMYYIFPAHLQIRQT